jgi:hypothetical protein
VTAENSVYSPHRKKHYCGVGHWKECDALYAEKMQRLREEAA